MAILKDKRILLSVENFYPRLGGGEVVVDERGRAKGTVVAHTERVVGVGSHQQAGARREGGTDGVEPVHTSTQIQAQLLIDEDIVLDERAQLAAAVLTRSDGIVIGGSLDTLTQTALLDGLHSASL